MSKEILARIDQRLATLDMAESAASKKAGLSDSAIRNVRRAIAAGKEQSFNVKTLQKLAPALQTSVEWLTTGQEPPVNPLGKYVGKAFDLLPQERKDDFEADIRGMVKERLDRLGVREE